MSEITRRNTSSYLLLILLCLAVAVTYRPRPTFFSQDDFWFLEQVTRADNLPKLWQLFGAPDYFYRPVPRVLILKIEQVVFDLQPFAYHAFSWLVHIANCGMVFGLWQRLWKNTRLSLVAALFYGLHYAHFVPVTWVSGMQELSVIAWSLICLLSHVRHRWRWSYGLPWIAFGMALLSKETGLSVLVVIIVLEIILERKARSLASYLPGMLGYVGTIMAYLWLRAQKSSGLPSSGPYAWHLEPGLIAKNARWYVLEGLYLREWITPVLGTIVLAALGGLFLAALASPRHRKPIIVGSVWFLTGLAPVLLLDRTYSYYLCLPLLGLGLVVAAILDAAWGNLRQHVFLAAPVWRWLSPIAATTLLVCWLGVNQATLLAVRQADPLGLENKAAISQQAILQVLHLYPDLPDGSTLYIRGATERDFWAMGKGSLFYLYYYPQKIKVLFDIDTPLKDLQSRHDVYIYDYKYE